MFSPIDGISMTIAPRKLVTGLKVNYKINSRIELVSYVQTHEYHNNGTEYHKIRDIYLCETGNAHGGNYFLSLETGIWIHQYFWAVTPISNEVVDYVCALAHCSKSSAGIKFGLRDGTEISVKLHDEIDKALDDKD